MKYCVKCGARLQDSDQFCPKCGTPAGSVPSARSTAGTQIPDAENIRLVREYLDRAKEMEWTLYTLQQIGARLQTRRSEAETKKSQTGKEIDRLEKGIADAENSGKNYTRGTYQRAKYRGGLDLSWGGWLVSFLIVSVLIVITMFAGGSGLPVFSDLYRIVDRMGQSIGLFKVVVILFVVIPAGAYLLAKGIGYLLARNRFIDRQTAEERDFNRKQADQEKETKEGYRETVRRNRERIGTLQEELTAIDKVTLPQLNEEIRENEEAVSSAEKALNQYYEPNVIFYKYRGLVPVTAFAEYFAARRCYSLEGPDGAYNIYENEMRLNTINAKLDNVQASLNHLARQHSAILSSLNQMNSNVQGLVDSVDAANQKNLAAARQIESGVQSIGYSTQLRNYYQDSMNRSLRHLDYMRSVDYYSRHLF